METWGLLLTPNGATAGRRLPLLTYVHGGPGGGFTYGLFPQFMHIVSQVEGKLSAAKTPYDLMRATFPAGTLSGAPKIRAMQIIAELEQTARGPYGGCVGYFSFNGNLDCCITIRTALIKDGKAYIQAGGGWVNDSTPEGEYDETVNKAKAMLKAVALAETFDR